MTLEKTQSVDRSQIELSAIFAPECVVTIPSDMTKQDVLQTLVESLVQAGRLSPSCVEAILSALAERERLGTTALGRGLALPHLRSRDVSDFAGAIGVAPSGVDFASLDGLPTRMIILIISPFDERTAHGEIMGRLATLLSDKTLQYSVRVPRAPEALFRFLGF